MKKIVFTLLALIINFSAANAESIIGVALTDFSTENPEKVFSVKIEEAFSLDNLKTFNKNTVFYGPVVKVENGLRGKRRGYFVFTPTYYSTEKGVHKVYRKDVEVKVTYYKPFNAEETAKSLALTGASTVVNHYVPFFSQGLSFVKGAVIEPEEGTNRVVSGVKKVYKDSPLSYIEKGEPLIIKPGQEVKLTIEFEADE